MLELLLLLHRTWF